MFGGLAGGGWYLKGHPELVKKLTDSSKAGLSPSLVFPNSPTDSVAKVPVAPGDTSGASTPAASTEPAPTPKTASTDLAMNSAPAPGAAPADAGMSAPAGGSMGAAPAGDSGTPTLFAPRRRPPRRQPERLRPWPARIFSKPPPAAVPAAPAATPAPARTVAKIIAPVAIKTAYGVVTIAPGTALKIISKEGGVVRLNYMNQTIAVPVTATDVEP